VRIVAPDIVTDI